MKLFHKIIAPLLLSAAFVSCGTSADEVDPLRSIFKEADTTKMDDLSKYAQRYFGDRYNVDIRFKYEDRLALNEYKLIPPTEVQALKYMNLLRYTFFEVYDKAAPAGFAERHTVKQLVLFGTIGFGPRQNLLGDAANGIINVYDINSLQIPNYDDADKNWTTFSSQYDRARDRYVQTLYHESAHTLHQDQPIPEEFIRLTISDYQQDNAFIYWYDRGISSLTAGFISDYASKNPEEDLAELYGYYMILLPEEWEAKMVQADARYSTNQLTGRQIIERKLEIMKRYLRTNYNLDIETVRAEANRRMCAFKSGSGWSLPAFEEATKNDFSKLPPSYYTTIPQY